MQKTLLKNYAKLVVNKGVNLQPGQVLIINSPISCVELTRALVEQGYKAKAKEVIINWNDDVIKRLSYVYEPLKNFEVVPQWVVEKYKYMAESNFCAISIASNDPHALDGINQKKVVASQKAMHPVVKQYRMKTAANLNQWCVISYPNEAWAATVFPNESKRNAYKKLEEAILKATRISKDSDPVENWKQHNANLHKYNDYMNKLNLDYLHITSSNGTDLVIHLADNHIWAGGADVTPQGIVFNPNMPTEECFSMPHKNKVNGRVVSTKPLNYGGQLIENFELTFKDGKAISCKAKTNQEVLEKMITMDEGASRLGEIALVPYNSPISESGILFFNTLFDENASCHLALGNAYPINIANGSNLTSEELANKGANSSMIHVDFMFGAKDTNVVGVDKKGNKHQIFKDGNWNI